MRRLKPTGSSQQAWCRTPRHPVKADRGNGHGMASGTVSAGCTCVLLLDDFEGAEHATPQGPAPRDRTVIREQAGRKWQMLVCVRVCYYSGHGFTLPGSSLLPVENRPEEGPHTPDQSILGWSRDTPAGEGWAASRLILWESIASSPTGQSRAGGHP
ncbi:hypothetical protein VTN02DRAFT_145 [Thermoascus thermophilus]